MSEAASDSARILVVDDDAAVCWALERALKECGYEVKVVADADAALRRLARIDFDAVLTDVRMPGSRDGLDLLSTVRDRHPLLPVVVMTAHGTVESAVEAVQRGAFDYLPKPIDFDQLGAVLGRAVGQQRVVAAAGPAADAPDSAIIGKTPAMQEVYRRIAAAANSDLGVLLTGASGTGKELVARALYRHSSRREGPFVAVNCGALPDNLVESELFGHEAGAFTDAKTRRIGRIEAADRGVLFLDEIGELPLPSQAKLLRFLEDQRFTRVGGEEELEVDVRIVAATNVDLEHAIAGGVFREDLGYRLRVVTIAMPSLAERVDDIPLLARHFLERIATRLGRELALTEDAERALLRHEWSGNVRELKHVVEEAAVLATGGIIDVEHLGIGPAGDAEVPGAAPGLNLALRSRLAQLFRRHPGEVLRSLQDEIDAIAIAEALSRTGGNQLRAAELLGMNRITLKKRMDQLGITK